MKTRFRLVCIEMFVLSLALGLGVCGSPAAEVSKDMCLECHGPFDKLATDGPELCGAKRGEDHPTLLRAAYFERGKGGPGVQQLPSVTSDAADSR